MKKLLLLTLLLSAMTLFAEESQFPIKVSGTELVLNDGTERRFFLHGMVDNAPRYGRKLSDKYKVDEMEERLKHSSDIGANAMRWNAFFYGRDFLWDANGNVTGLAGNGLSNLKDCLDRAATHKIMIQIVLSTAHFQQYSGETMSKEHNETSNENRVKNLHQMFTTEAGTQAYINNILKPMIDTIGVHPALFGFLLSNELHGMTDMPESSPYGDGWASTKGGLLVPEADFQKFFNLVSGELHRKLPGVICGISLTAKRRNQFTSETLIAAGGDSDGVLDIYQLQYYPGDHKEFESPFDYSLEDIADVDLGIGGSIDKPVIAGEFWMHGITDQNKSSILYTPTEAYEKLWDNGYSGGFGWSAFHYENDWSSDAAKIASIDAGYLALKENQLAGLDPWTIEITNPTYTLTVSNGDGTGDYPEATELTITADEAPEGMIFHRWTGDTSIVSDPTESTITVTTGSEEMTLVATYKENLASSIDNSTMQLQKINALSVHGVESNRIELRIPEAEAYTVQIMNVQGKMLFEKRLALNVGVSKISLGVNLSGMNIIRVRNLQTGSLLVQKAIFR